MTAPHGDSITVYCQGGKRGYINLRSGKLITKAMFDKAWVFEDYLAPVEINSYRMFIERDGAFAFPKMFLTRYESEGHFIDCKCIVRDEDGRCGVIDTTGQWVITHEFNRRGWQVEPVYIGAPMPHHEKYLLINQAFQGHQRLMPFFNRQNNDDLILAIQAAGISNGRNGFRKNKAGEKLAESEEDLLQHRTDGTDAFDTLYIGCEKFPQHHLPLFTSNGIY
ncbi:MAG: WG repeat-containing protein [Bacteroidales bacterium]|nr:WG repeat-containing protein [Bacteroidales bacterium]